MSLRKFDGPYRPSFALAVRTHVSETFRNSCIIVTYYVFYGGFFAVTIELCKNSRRRCHIFTQLYARLTNRRRFASQPNNYTSFRRALLPLTGLTVFLGVFLLADALSWTQAPLSDSANLLIQAHSMLDGNWLLHGWLVGSHNYYLTDLPVWVVAEVLRGESFSLIHQIPALLYALSVTAAILLAVLGKSRPLSPPGVVVLALLLVPAALALPWIVEAGYHIGTTVFLSASALLVAGHFTQGWPKRTWWWGLGLLSCAVVSDPIALPAGVAALLTALALRWRDGRRILRPMSETVIAMAGGEALRHLIPAMGGFVMQKQPLLFTSWGGLSHHVNLAVQALLGFFGADPFGKPVGASLAIALLHTAMALLVIGSLWTWAKGIFAPNRDFVRDLASSAALWSILAYMLTNYAGNLTSMRFLIPAFFAATVGFARGIHRAPPRIQISAALAACLFAISGASGYSFRPSAPPQAVLADWLERHHLQAGYAEYWSASITTALTNGRVNVIQVGSGGNPVQIVAYPLLSSERWYLRHGLPAAPTFIVLDGTDQFGVTSQAAIHTWGAPQHIAHIGPYEILQWSHPIFTG